VRRGEIEARRFGHRVVIPTIVIDRLLDTIEPPSAPTDPFT
jgi:hypothetical protein